MCQRPTRGSPWAPDLQNSSLATARVEAETSIVWQRSPPEALMISSKACLLGLPSPCATPSPHLQLLFAGSSLPKVLVAYITVELGKLLIFDCV